MSIIENNYNYPKSVEGVEYNMLSNAVLLLLRERLEVIPLSIYDFYTNTLLGIY